MALTIRNRNFTGNTTPPKADVYVGCNFNQPQPRNAAGKYRGRRLWPADDTPRVFRRCNMVNAEPPPGSRMIDCNTAILERDVDLGAGKRGLRIHGRRRRRAMGGEARESLLTYEDKATPEEVVVE